MPKAPPIVINPLDGTVTPQDLGYQDIEASLAGHIGTLEAEVAAMAADHPEPGVLKRVAKHHIQAMEHLNAALKWLEYERRQLETKARRLATPEELRKAGITVHPDAMGKARAPEATA